MVIISYDIADDKLRTRFSKYLCRFGHRIQYSVFEIENSNKLLNNIISDIENKHSKHFTEADSVYIFKLSSSCEVLRYGYAKHEEGDIIIVK
jgi:CRISPR-associated protein Cas2